MTVICKHITDAFGSDEQQTRIRMLCDPVTNRVLNQMLQRKTRERGGQERIGNSELRSQSIREARLFDRDVLSDEFEFLAERDFICAMTSERASQHFAQMFDDTHSALRDRCHERAPRSC